MLTLQPNTRTSSGSWSLARVTDKLQNQEDLFNPSRLEKVSGRHNEQLIRMRTGFKTQHKLIYDVISKFYPWHVVSFVSSVSFELLTYRFKVNAWFPGLLRRPGVDRSHASHRSRPKTDFAAPESFRDWSGSRSGSDDRQREGQGGWPSPRREWTWCHRPHEGRRSEGRSKFDCQRNRRTRHVQFPGLVAFESVKLNFGKNSVSVSTCLKNYPLQRGWNLKSSLIRIKERKEPEVASADSIWKSNVLAMFQIPQLFHPLWRKASQVRTAMESPTANPTARSRWVHLELLHSTSFVRLLFKRFFGSHSNCADNF